MQILPAIDLKNGMCVRLLQGKKDRETIYSDDPARMALRWQGEGADYLHLVDLDGAFEGTSKNVEAIRSIVEATNIPAELGGGIRDMGAITKLLSLGLDRVILGTVAVTDPDLVRGAIERFGPQKIVVGIDASKGNVAVKGWEEISEVPALELTLKMKKFGVERIIYTDISKDGMMVGPNIAATKQLAQQSGLKVIASGGVSTLEDVRNVAALEPFGIDGMIIGKALYEGAINLKEALALL
ncbi:MAG: 1-(5-phosphoribosyl)-5-[(5-phosphoribosylamino)methylideneamino]imidazole-4-carboxamide isomerase, partial [Candidatus Latescibacteria bacterium]|nr:1-(5-phosphoribosyl)-5-[(5-phosphoribosylamino)methylideneamino]imidazole-4-carboxamide isomerase [Candidatus Latescibacterota bacterium]